MTPILSRTALPLPLAWHVTHLHVLQQRTGTDTPGEIKPVI